MRSTELPAAASLAIDGFLAKSVGILPIGIFTGMAPVFDGVVEEEPIARGGVTIVWGGAHSSKARNRDRWGQPSAENTLTE